MAESARLATKRRSSTWATLRRLLRQARSRLAELRIGAWFPNSKTAATLLLLLEFSPLCSKDYSCSRMIHPTKTLQLAVLLALVATGKSVALASTLRASPLIVRVFAPASIPLLLRVVAWLPLTVLALN